MDGDRMESVRWLEHDADVLLEARAASLGRLFAVAGEALAGLMLVGPPPPAEEKRSVRVSAEGTDDLLVAWLNELIYLIAGRIFFPAEIRTIRLSERLLEAELAGAGGGSSFPELAREVKAATYHELEIAEGRSGWRCRVLFDV